MKLSDFDYNLPKELIANSHMEPRDHSRLLVLDHKSGQIEHKHFYDIVDYLKKDDILVFNNSKVFKARIFGKKETGGKREFLLVRPTSDFLWEVMIKRKTKIGDRFSFDSGLNCKVLQRLDERLWQVRFNKNQDGVFKFLEKHGSTPLPPYVKNTKPTKGFYQTVYASKTGSVAAPTAGFHFTNDLIKKIKAKGVECLEITLHIGLGTFVPVEAENIKDHKMHEEFFEIKKDVWNRIVETRRGVSKKRIIAVGTTTCRVLEFLGAMNRAPTKANIFGSTDIFIYPPYEFKIVDGLITNFHLPKSTLLMLVSAFADPRELKGIEKIKKAYQEAIKRRYRFYSFGDSMFIK